MFDLPGMKGLGQTMKAATVLDAGVKVRMNPLELRKAGAIIDNMQGAMYTEEEINHICRALFCDQSEEDMRKAWEVFDPENQGQLDAEEFKTILPLMGEAVPEDEIAAMFEAADSDGSGLLEFDEFVQLVRAMNPKERDEKEEEPSVAEPEPAAEEEEPEPELPPELEPVPAFESEDLRSHRVFGVQLKVLCFRAQETRGVPKLVSSCTDLVRKSPLNSDLFQPPNSALVGPLDELMDVVDKGDNLENSDVCLAALLVLRFVELLPEPIIPASMYATVLDAQALNDPDLRVECLSSVLIALPPANVDLLMHLLEFTGVLMEHQEKNRCTAVFLAEKLGNGILRRTNKPGAVDEAAVQVVVTMLESGVVILEKVKAVLEDQDYDDTEVFVSELMETGELEALQGPP